MNLVPSISYFSFVCILDRIIQCSCGNTFVIYSLWQICILILFSFLFILPSIKCVLPIHWQESPVLGDGGILVRKIKKYSHLKGSCIVILRKEKREEYKADVLNQLHDVLVVFTSIRLPVKTEGIGCFFQTVSQFICKTYITRFMSFVLTKLHSFPSFFIF